MRPNLIILDDLSESVLLTPAQIDKYIKLFEERYPELVRSFHKLSTETLRAKSMFEELSPVLQTVSKDIERFYPYKKNVRVSSRTGHSWPKAKGSY